MKKNIIFLFLLFSQVIIPQNLDDLINTAKKSNTAKDWNNIAYYFLERYESDAPLFTESANKAYTLAVEENDSVEIARALLFTSIVAYYEDDYESHISKNIEALSFLPDSDEYELLAMIYDKLANAYGDIGQFTPAIEYFKKVVFYKSKLYEDKPEIALELNNIAINFANQGNIDSALYYVHEALDIGALTDDTLRMINSNNILGVLYKRKGNLNKAIEYYGNTLDLYRSMGKFENMSQVFMNISTLYHDSKKPDKALDFSRTAVSNSFKYPYDNKETGVILNNHGATLLANRLYRQAVDTVMLARDYLVSNPYQLYINSITLSSCYSGLNKMDSCGIYLDEAESVLTVNKEFPAYRFYKAKGTYLYKMNRYNEAIEHLEEYSELLKNKKVIHTSDDYVIYNMLADAYFNGNQNYKKAFINKEIAYAMRDSLLKEEHNAAISDFYAKYKTAEKELEISRLNEKQQATRFQMAIIISVSLLFIVLFLIAFLYNRIKRLRKEKEATLLATRIEQKENEYKTFINETEQRLVRRYLDGRESERKSLAKELHDSVANEVVSIIMQVKSDVGDKENISKLLEKTYSHIRQISHRLMPPDFNYMSLPEMIEDYVSVLNEASSVRFMFVMDEKDRKMAEDIPEQVSKELYCIIQEASGNILKHAEAQKVNIRLSLEHSRLILSIKDDGKGFDIGTKHRGIGLKTINDRSKEIGAVFSITSSLGNGTEITISLSEDLTPLRPM